MIKLNKTDIINLLREPIFNRWIVWHQKTFCYCCCKRKKISFFVQGHFPEQPVMPGVLIVESFGQAAAALTAHGLDRSTYENKLVF